MSEEITGWVSGWTLADMRACIRKDFDIRRTKAAAEMSTCAPEKNVKRVRITVEQISKGK